ncbi:hypothetical protein BMS3Bbin10_01020 [bacterium BMS3Bbin10]|nr:hypothetical protein BMS3Bbin10_01020 [bacterium BMS3Bbin10]
MRILRFPAVILAVLVAFPALAQETAPGRYTMTPTAEGLLRLDTQTGEVSLCSKLAGNWTCRSVPDDRIALENEIDRLNAENRRLRVELGKPGAGDGEKQGQSNQDGKGSKWWLPSDREVAEFKSFLEKMMRGFKALVEPPPEDKPEKQL